MLKLYLAQINTIVGDLDGNKQKILREFRKAEEQNCDLVIFCEMTICGYPCQDLWQKSYFIKKANEKISEIADETKSSKCAILLGGPAFSSNRHKKEVINNAAFLIENGVIKRIIRKKNLPNYGVFDEKRYFEAENSLSFVEFRDQTLAILICEDIWDFKTLYLLQEQIFDCMISINSSPYSTNKHLHRQKIISKFVKQLKKPLIYVNQVGAEESLVFDGSSFVMDEQAQIVLKMREFAVDAATILVEKGWIDACRKSDKITEYDIDNRDYSACVLALRDYIEKNDFKKVILGMSGGIDSALVAAIAVDALGSENVTLYALPTRFNSQNSMNDAKNCAENLNCKLEIISIEKVFESMLSSLHEQFINTKSDLTEENLQSRIRGNILMALSNKFGALLLSTGNKSELSVGYATIYGDMCGAFNPLKDIYKTRVYQLANWRNRNIPQISLYQKIDLIPEAILSKAPSAELRENQKDSDSLPEYDILDKILYALVDQQRSLAEIIKSGFDENLVKKVAKLLHNSEYKRRQAVIGTKISDMSFDKDRRYPMTNKFFD